MTNSPPRLLRRTVFQIALIVGVVVILYYGKALLIPLAIAGILAMLLNPIDEKLRSWGWSPNLAIAGAMMVLILFFVALFAAVGQQAYSFAQNWETVQENLAEQLTSLRNSLGLEEVVPKVEETKEGDTGSVMDKLPVSKDGVVSMLSGTFGVAGDFLLMLVYVVLFLSQKERLREFILRRMPDDQRGLTHQTLNESKDVVQKYLRGRLILIAILSVLYSVGFLIVGLDYAILIAILVAVLSIIPYLGNIIGGLFAVALAFASGGDSFAIWGIVITISVAQTLESYVLTPLIVGDEVDINPLTTIVCVIGLSIVWGAVGAIIAIPIMAILRIIFSHVEGLEDYAFVLGQEKF